MKNFLLFCIIFFLTSCNVSLPRNNAPQKAFTNLAGKRISLNDFTFKACTFHPATKIFHFPMRHFPSNKNYNEATYNKIVKSQFQLMHTILHYGSKIAVFDENITQNGFNQSLIQELKLGNSRGTYTRIDGSLFHLQDIYNQAHHLFGQDNSGRYKIPDYYESLNVPQKEYLFSFGASFLLYFLGQVPTLHKVIEEQEWDLAKRNIFDSFGQEKPNVDHWIFTFREQKLKNQVSAFFKINPAYKGIAFISYGKAHNFSDDFRGFAFADGHSCLNWDK